LLLKNVLKIALFFQEQSAKINRSSQLETNAFWPDEAVVDGAFQ
jgi:hypothetical protein